MELSQAMTFIRQNAEQHQEKTPTIGTLLEEVVELARLLEGEHLYHPGLVLVRIGGVAANMLSRYEWLEVNATLRERQTIKKALA